MRQVHINPRTSALKITLQCKSRFGKSVNPETVRNVLRKHKYHDRVPQRKPCISNANREARLAFAEMYVRQPTEYRENIIFVYESKYNIFDSDGKQKVWWKSNTAMHVKNLRATVKYGRDLKGTVGHLQSLLGLTLTETVLIQKEIKVGHSRRCELLQNQAGKIASKTYLTIEYYAPLTLSEENTLT
ncbi:HTH_Tnp_Tc3_2 domain-containing protein [Trichonephila clavipes]|nr:HTH_Tnp_Tc3_2 domain-containing protein [Trichonephila clavipes]